MCSAVCKSYLLYLLLVQFLLFKPEQMSPQNWDDDFDFQDSPPKGKKVQQKQKQKTDDDDFFNDNSNKLPVLNYKNTPKHANQTKKAISNKNPYADVMKLRGNVYDDDNIEDQVQPAPKNKNQTEEEVDFQEDIDYDPPKKEQKKQSLKTLPKEETKAKPKQQPKVQHQSEELEQNYEQQNFEEDYGQDFEEVQVEEPPSKVSNNKVALAQQQPTQKAQAQNKKVFNPPKPPSRASQGSKNEASKGRNLTVDKNLVRNNSRNSLKSVESKRGVSNSRAVSYKFSTNASFVANKYTSEIDKTFPEVNLSDLNQDKVNKLNQKLRVMIKKFNQQLNELINKNMLHLKAKKNDKSKVESNKLRVLEEQCKNNETMIEIMTKEFDKLSGRDGELREEQYQLLTEKRIEQIKEQIKESQKTIVKLKNQTKSQGNKLTNKNEDKKLAAEMHHLKTTLVQSKKDEQKQNSRIEKLDQQMLSLGEKVSDLQYKISELVDLAKDKGIQLDNKEDAHKKFEVLRKKVEASKNHKSKLQNLLKTKSDIVAHEKQQLRINIKNCELQIKNLYDSISHSHNESVKVVEKAKTNPKINQNLLSDLDAILKSLELILHDNYSVRSEQNKSHHSNRPLKNSAIGNMESPDLQKRSQSVNNNDKHSFGNLGENNSKPNLLKKKMKVNEILEEGKNEAERIWKEEEKEKKEKQEKVKQPQKIIIEDKKKPFTLKKNRLGGETKITEERSLQDVIAPQGLKLEIEIKRNDQQKKEEVSLAGPKMMKFKRRTNQPKEQQKQEGEKPVELKLVIQEKPKIVDEQQPVFAPKRFNLRNRMEKKEESYVPTVQKETKKEVVVEEKKQQYKPKFNFGEVDDPYKRKDPAQSQMDKKQPQKITIPGLGDEEKPKLNLRLRDRMKNTEQKGYTPSGVAEIKKEQKTNWGQQKTSQANNPYVASTNNNPYAPKQTSNNQYVPKQPLSNPYAPKENVTTKNNPYAPKEAARQNSISVEQNSNPYAPKQQSLPSNPNNPYIQNQREGRKKQGPVKKPKAQPAATKQKINIYEQAQEVEGMNQFVNEPPKRQPQFSYKPQANNDLNLNDLLGVQKTKKNNDDLADLLGGANNNKKIKKNNDFFDDIDL